MAWIRTFCLQTGISRGALCLYFIYSMAAHAQQPAFRADEFMDFVGINAAPFDKYLDSGPWAGAGTKYPADYFYDLGIRHYRTCLFNDLVRPESPDLMLSAWKKHGVQPMLLIDAGKTKSAPEVLEKVKAIDPRVIGEIEGPNEVNNKFPPQELNLRFAGKTDEAAGSSFMGEVFRALKNDPSTKGIPVVAFTAIFTDYRLARPHEGFDFSNMHSYQGYDVPSSSLLMNEVRFNRILPNGGVIRPFVPTECGYNVEEDRSNGTRKTGSLRAQALNLPMLLAEYFRHGIRRTYLFALHNADGYGLLESDQTTKRPSWFALKNFLSILRDATWNPQSLRWEGGDGFTPQALLFSMENAPATIHSLTLQKKNGDHLLLLWNEVKNFDSEARDDLRPAPVPVKLHFQTPVETRAELLVQNDSGRFDSHPFQIEAGTLSIEVPSSVAIVRLRGTAPSAKVTPPDSVESSATENSIRLSWQPSKSDAVAGYFIYRNDGFVASTTEASYKEASEWIRPGLGYRYAVQAFDEQGNVSQKLETVVRTPSKFPDLIISRLEAPEVHAGDSVRFRSAMTNIGEGATPHNVNASVTFQVSDTFRAWGGSNGKPIQPGETIEFEAGGGPNGVAEWKAAAGAHVLRAVIDDINRIPGENSKTNNTIERSLLVDVNCEGLLSVASEAAPAAMDLTREGPSDWIHWGQDGKHDVVRKAGGGRQISDLSFFGEGHQAATPGFGVRASWSDGDRVKDQPGTNSSYWLNGVGHGYEFSVPADTTERILKVIVGGIDGARGEFSAQLSDGSAPDFLSTTWNGNAAFDWAPVPSDFHAVYTVRFRAASPGQKLTVRWKLVGEPNRFLGQARLQSATLTAPATQDHNR